MTIPLTPAIPIFSLFSRGNTSKMADCKTTHLGSSAHGSRSSGISTVGRSVVRGILGELSGLGGTVVSEGAVMVGSATSGKVGDAVTTMVSNTVGDSVGISSAVGDNVGSLVVLNTVGESVGISASVGDNVGSLVVLNTVGDSVGTGVSPRVGEFVETIGVGSTPEGSVTVGVGWIVDEFTDGVDANVVGGVVTSNDGSVGADERPAAGRSVGTIGVGSTSVDGSVTAGVGWIVDEFSDGVGANVVGGVVPSNGGSVGTDVRPVTGGSVGIIGVVSTSVEGSVTVDVGSIVDDD
jgi:hypothetical protein